MQICIFYKITALFLFSLYSFLLFTTISIELYKDFRTSQASLVEECNALILVRHKHRIPSTLN